MAVFDCLWMLERTVDMERSFDEATRRWIDAVLTGTGWETVLAYEPRHRLTKQHFQLVFE